MKFSRRHLPEVFASQVFLNVKFSILILICLVCETCPARADLTSMQKVADPEQNAEGISKFKIPAGYQDTSLQTLTPPAAVKPLLTP